MNSIKQLLLGMVFITMGFTTYAQVGIGTGDPNASAALDLESTTRGFLLPRMTHTQINVIVSPAEGLMVYCLNCVPIGLYVYNDGSFKHLSFGTASIVAGKDATTAIVDLTSISGQVWMDRNLGATQAATSSTDTNSYGDYYQWGRAKDGHESRNSNTTSTRARSGDPGHSDFIIGSSAWDYNWTDFDEEDALWQAGLNDPCPIGYRLPTAAEWEVELANITDEETAFTYLKLPLAGVRATNGSSKGLVIYDGTNGYYWSSSVDIPYSENLNFGTDYARAFINIAARGHGLSVRCLKE